MSRELLARAWSAGAGPGDAPFTIDLDSTICETYGLAKEGARHHGYTGQRGYHPLLAVAAGTGEVLMSRLREGRANTARGAAHFLRETVSRVRYGGASGQLTMRADSGFYAHALARLYAKFKGSNGCHHVGAPPPVAGVGGFFTIRRQRCCPGTSGYLVALSCNLSRLRRLKSVKSSLVAVCREMDVRFSITVRQHQSLRNLIEAIPEADWTPIPYWMDGAADVAETTYTPFQSEPEAAPVRLIVRRVKPTPGSQLALFAATPRSRTRSETSSTASDSTISPQAASPPTPPGWPSK